MHVPGYFFFLLCTSSSVFTSKHLDTTTHQSPTLEHVYTTNQKYSQRIKLLLRHKVIIELLHLGRTNNSVDGSERRSQEGTHHECLPLSHWESKRVLCFCTATNTGTYRRVQNVIGANDAAGSSLPALWALVFQFGGNFCSDRNGGNVVCWGSDIGPR